MTGVPIQVPTQSQTADIHTVVIRQDGHWWPAVWVSVGVFLAVTVFAVVWGVKRTCCTHKSEEAQREERMLELVSAFRQSQPKRFPVLAQVQFPTSEIPEALPVASDANVQVAACPKVDQA